MLGLGPIWMSEQRGGQAARGRAPRRAARSSPSACPRRSTAPTSTRTDMIAHADGDGGYLANGTKYYIGNGNAAGLVSVFGKIAPTSEAGRVRLLRRRQRSTPPTSWSKNVVRLARCTSASSRSHDYPVTDADILHTGPRRLERRAQHRQRRQVQPRLGLDRHLHARLLRGHHPRRTTACSTAARSPTSRTCASCFVDAYARLVAMKLFGDPRRRLLPLGLRRRPPLPAVQPDGEDEGHHRGRERHRPAVGRHRRQGLREGHVLRHGGRATSARLPKLEGTVHVNIALIVKFMPNYFFAPQPSTPRCRRARTPPTTTSSSTRARPAASARSASTTGGRPTPRTPTLPNVARLPRAGRGPRDACSPTRRARRGPADATSTSCSPSASCSRWSSTASSSWSRPS